MASHSCDRCLKFFEVLKICGKISFHVVKLGNLFAIAPLMNPEMADLDLLTSANGCCLTQRILDQFIGDPRIVDGAYRVEFEHLSDDCHGVKVFTSQSGREVSNA